MTDNVYDDWGWGGSGRSFSDAPEVRAKQRNARQAAPTHAQRLEAAEAEIRRLRGENAAGEAAIRQAAEQLLDSAAFDTTEFSDVATAAQTADTLLTSGGSDRLAAYVDAWAATDPHSAAAWAEDRQGRIAQFIAQREHQESQSAYAADEIQRLGEIAEWASEKGTVAADELATAAPYVAGTAEEFELVHEGLEEAERAKRRIGAAQEVWNAFRSPEALGVRALDKTTGERREPLADYTENEAAVASQMRPLRHQRQAIRGQQVEDFKAAFSQEARSSFAEGMAETRAKGREARANEYDEAAAKLRRERGR